MIQKIKLALACVLVCVIPLLAEDVLDPDAERAAQAARDIQAGAERNARTPLALRAWAPEEILSIRIQPLEDDGAILSVELAVPANLVLYYDSQPPRNENIPETYWFRERSGTRGETHTLRLGDIEKGRTYYFRLVATWPTEKWSAPMRWTIPARSMETLVIK
ncbi:MAG: hypothetical protein LBC99_01045 [Spirochaetota bacterium]|jgi:hypothetical protein|nr:hypothetical protein [Spirochaetota bacterium]